MSFTYNNHILWLTFALTKSTFCDLDNALFPKRTATRTNKKCKRVFFFCTYLHNWRHTLQGHQTHWLRVAKSTAEEEETTTVTTNLSSTEMPEEGAVIALTGPVAVRKMKNEKLTSLRLVIKRERAAATCVRACLCADFLFRFFLFILGGYQLKRSMQNFSNE